jgi:hypothetical protein
VSAPLGALGLPRLELVSAQNRFPTLAAHRNERQTELVCRTLTGKGLH